MNAHNDTIGDTVYHRAFHKTPGIRLPANYIITAARRRTPEQATAMRWLSNYAAITGRELEDFCEPFGMDVRSLRECLTTMNPTPQALALFVAGVRKTRAAFEARMEGTGTPRDHFGNPFRRGSSMWDGYGPLAQTRVTKTVAQALNKVRKEGAMAEIIGLTRIGKTTPAVQWFLRNLDVALFISCPETDTERDWLQALARAACVSSHGGHSNSLSAIRERIEDIFAPGGYSVLIVDEGHNVWNRTSRKGAPKRLEFLRRLRDVHGVGVALLATPQFTEHLATALSGDARWAPGQYDGRTLPYHLPETLSDADLALVARHHAPDFDAALIDELVGFAKRSQGYCGAMVNLITRAQDAFDDHPDKPRLALLQEAAKRQENGRRAELKARGKLTLALPRIGGAK